MSAKTSLEILEVLVIPITYKPWKGNRGRHNAEATNLIAVSMDNPEKLAFWKYKNKNEIIKKIVNINRFWFNFLPNIPRKLNNCSEKWSKYKRFKNNK